MRSRRCLVRASSASCSSMICSPVGVTLCSLPSVPEMRARILGERAETSMVIAYNHDSLARVYEALGKRKRPRNTAMPPISGANLPRASWPVSCGREDHRTLSALQGKSRDGVATNGWRRSGLPQGWQCHKNRAGCPKADTQVGISGHLARKADLGIGRRIPRSVFAAPKGVPFSPEKTRANVRSMC